MQATSPWSRRACAAATATLLVGVLAAGVPSLLDTTALAGSPVGIVQAAASATAQADRSTPPTSAATGSTPSGRFATLPPGSPLPGDAECAARVRPTAELRPANAKANATRGVGPTAGHPRVTGNFTGSTDELLQWVACKWGIDEDVVRAQIVKESSWKQSAGGDLTSDPSLCHPSLRGSLPCAESVGLGQVRFRYHSAAFTNDNALRSSAYNLDYTYSVWRECFEGQVGWLNNVERGGTYAAGDMWGCIGVWFSGRWLTPAATGYIAVLKDILQRRVWETAAFASS
jgi:hypothetical protein